MTKMMATVFAKMSHTQDSSSRRVASRLLLTLAFAVIGVASPMAHADHKGADFKAFIEEIRSAQAQCAPNQECRPEGFDFVTLHTADKTDSSIAPFLPAFQSIAKDQANIWADTILEGSFDSDGTTQLDRVDGVMQNGELIAYRVTYSEQAWVLDDGGQRQDAGRITESTFVSLPLSSWFRDNWALATFK